MAEQELESGIPGETERKLLEPLLQGGSAIPERNELQKRALRQIAEQGFVPGFTLVAAALTAFHESSSVHKTPEIAWQKRLLFNREIGPLVERKIQERSTAPHNQHEQWTVTSKELRSMPAVLRQQFTPEGQLKKTAYVAWLRVNRYASKVEQLAHEPNALILMQVPLVKFGFTRTLAESTEKRAVEADGSQRGFAWVFVILAFFALKGFLLYQKNNDVGKTLRKQESYLTQLQEQNSQTRSSNGLPPSVETISPSSQASAKASQAYLSHLMNNQKGLLYLEVEASRALANKDYEAAEAAYTNYMNANPENVLLYCKRGEIYKLSKKWELAVQDYTRAIELDGEMGQYYCARGTCLLELRQYEEAIQDLTTAIDNGHDKKHTYYYRARCYSNTNNYEAAIIDYNTALNMEPDDFRAHYYRGVAYSNTGQYEQAEVDFLAALKLEPDSIRTKNTYAWQLATSSDEKFQNGELAVELATEVCEKTEWKDPAYLDTLAAAYARCGRFEEAVEQQQKAYDLVNISEKADYYYRLDLYQNQQAYVDPIEAKQPETKAETPQADSPPEDQSGSASAMPKQMIRSSLRQTNLPPSYAGAEKAGSLSSGKSGSSLMEKPAGSGSTSAN